MVDPLEYVLPGFEWVHIPAASADEGRAHQAAFKMGRFPITNAQYEVFVEADGYKDPAWWQDLGLHPSSPRKSDWDESTAPKLQVCWFEAVGFTRWLSAVSGLAVRLPTAAEWRWAAVGDSGWSYLYGPEFDAQCCNMQDSGLDRTNDVMRYADVATHFGVVDMAGNVWEWMLESEDDTHPLNTTGDGRRILCGGSWRAPASQGAAGHHRPLSPRSRTYDIGFRIILDGSS